MVRQTKARIHWPLRRILRHLEVAPATYHRWRKATLRLDGAALADPGAAAGASVDGDASEGMTSSPAVRACPSSLFETLPAERQAILAYARAHPELRHRELAWKMLDEGACAVSPSTVYRILGEANLVCRWKPRTRRTGHGRAAAPTRPNERWQTDIRYVKVGDRNYYLLAFLDVYSRYIAHHELLRFMDGRSVAIAAAQAIGKLPADGPRPTIQSDHGSCFIAREFAQTLDGMGVGHHLIRPHTPTDNAHIERCNRTIGERIDEQLEALEALNGTRSLKTGNGMSSPNAMDSPIAMNRPEPNATAVAAAAAVVAEVIDHYNHRRLHSSLHFLRPVDYYRGNPETLLAERRRKLSTARELRKQENLKLRQRLLPYPAAGVILNSERRVVSL